MFSKTGWKTIQKGLQDKFKKSWMTLQLKNKYNQLRQRQRRCKAILNETGVGYVAATGKLEATEELLKKKQRLPCRTSTRQGHGWVQEVLHGHKTRIYESLRMDKKTFKHFCKELKEHGGLSSSKNVTVEEQVAIFLRVLTHFNTARDGAELFQHSTATISKYLRRVLKAVIGCPRG
ncbi:hypothetical protein LINPERPRIM_LOCUS22454 [Linum perenne]